jgi:hypothetical protein
MSERYSIRKSFPTGSHYTIFDNVNRDYLTNAFDDVLHFRSPEGAQEWIRNNTTDFDSIERYTEMYDHLGENPDGGWVHYEDYKKLLDAYKALLNKKG